MANVRTLETCPVGAADDLWREGTAGLILSDTYMDKPPEGMIKRWSGGKWVRRCLQVYDGKQWVEARLRIWTGTQWWPPRRI